MSRNNFIIYEFLLTLSIGKLIPHFEKLPSSILNTARKTGKKKSVSTGNIFSSVTRLTD